MEPAEQHVDVRIHRRGRAKNLFHSRMGTPDNQDASERSINRQGEFAEF